MRRTSWAVWVAVAILASSLAGLMPEAAWANHIAQCPGPTGDFDVCFYADINWTGAEEVFTGTGLFNLNAALNDHSKPTARASIVPIRFGAEPVIGREQLANWLDGIQEL